MLGAVLSVGFAFFFGLNTIVVRRGVLRVSSNYMATLTVLSGPIYFFLLALITGDLFKIRHFKWEAIVFFALSGIVHFALGRTFAYRATQILGANRAGIVTGLNFIVSVLLAIIVLGERITPLMIFGIVLSLTGPLLIALKENQGSSRPALRANPLVDAIDRRTFYMGLFFGASCSLFWGTSPILIKLGLDHGGSSLAGSLIAYCSASLILGASLLKKSNRDEILKGDRTALSIALMSGMTTNFAQMLRYMALSYGTVIVVSMVSRTIPLWTLGLSFIFNRKIESFSWWVILGNALLTAGTILVLL
jgi:bacterial/archaeal transporter family protein